ncbi:MAG: hydrogenase expression/formation protein HypE [Kofleriaceae bacterium]|nr:MAG: hydrogenase expression/formation protein HypE [Kofleriaceae bacterium]MBZ0234982.1 hydrogenase expression/formation protein HypE [Kofleriaceae bacterium]
MRALRPVGDRITMEHGAGGGAMRALIEQIFADGLGDVASGGIGLAAMDDGAVLPVGDDRWLVITTDSHVIQPIFFPGGDIGRLSVSGTVNDLAMMGATEPLALTCATILEDGFRRDDLERIWRSIRATCGEAGTTVVTGDTKVMRHGELDGIVLNTTGIALTDRFVGDAGLRPGDRILVTGTVGDHGLAIMATRNELALETALCSDVGPINGLVRALLDAAGPGGVAAMKDPTRGGVSSALHEMAAKSKVGVVIDEQAVPLRDEVRAVGELLGIDPLLAANEGKAVLGVRPDVADAVLAAARAHPLGRDAAIIGVCVTERPGAVVLDTGFGRRLLGEATGELLPRIC